MSGPTIVEEVIEARAILSNVAHFDDVHLLGACRVIERHAFQDEAQGAFAFRTELEKQIAARGPVDFIRAEAAIELLEQVSAEGQILAFKNLCVNNGFWTVPDDPDAYRPVMFETELFGVFAAAETASELPVNWCRAARRVLELQDKGAPL